MEGNFLTKILIITGILSENIDLTWLQKLPIKTLLCPSSLPSEKFIFASKIVNIKAYDLCP